MAHKTNRNDRPHARPKINRSGEKCTLACVYCRTKKIKCNGQHPCSSCNDQDVECVFPPPHVRTRKKQRESHQVLQERLERLEALLSEKLFTAESRAYVATELDQNKSHDIEDDIMRAVNAMSRTANSVIETDGSNSSDHLSAQRSVASTQVSSQEVLSPLSEELEDLTMLNGQDSGPEITTTHSSVLTAVDCPQVSPQIYPSFQDTIHRHDTNPDPADAVTDQGLVAPQLSNSEHHGSASILSICSMPGVQWVTSQIGTSSFMASAQKLSLDVTREMKLSKKLSANRQPEPDQGLAWRYTKAHFSESLDAVFGIVNQQAYEAKLQSFFDGQISDIDDAWYALRHTIYASGCKVVLSGHERTDAFVHAQEESWKYFENALSVHTDVIYGRSGMLGIQALVQMAFFTEGLGNVALEYMLISNALRLAQSHGLHRQPPSSWNLSYEETLIRNWTFWTIYAYEKHIAFRSGRPSIIDDDDIDCDIPLRAPMGSILHAQFHREVINHAKITSAINRELTSVRASKQTPDILAQKVSDLEYRLKAWYHGMDPCFRMSLPSQNFLLPPGLSVCHAIYLHFAYHGSLIAIHSTFTYPWKANSAKYKMSDAVKDQQKKSTKVVIEASRKIILATKCIGNHAVWPTWLTFFYPLLGLMNIFIHLLRNPTLATSQSDMMLVDMAAGHFGYLEFIFASKVSFSSIKEIVHLARTVVNKCPNQNATETMPISNDACAGFDFSDIDLSILDTSSTSQNNKQHEAWPTFLPSLMDIGNLFTDPMLGGAQTCT